MTLTADLYFSFRSPYSYLAVGRYRAMTETYDLDIVLRPVWPLAVRQPDFFERNHPNWLGYTMRDMMRVAQFHDIPFGPPRPDPIVQDTATRKIAEEQPYIRYVTRMGQAAARRGRGVAFAHEMGQRIWGGEENWHHEKPMYSACDEAGLDFLELDDEISAMPRHSTPKSPPIRKRSKLQAIGACPRWCSTANPSSARTASQWRNGGWSNAGW